MATVCQILNDLGFRVEDLERRLAAIRLYSASQEGVNFHGTTWEVSGDQIAVWSSATNRPLSWSQGQWARLKAGKIEARGDAFTFKSSDTGARIEIDGTELAGYNSGGTKQFYLSAADGKGYFAGGNAVMGADGIVLADQLDIIWDTTIVADVIKTGVNIEIESDPTENSLANLFGVKSLIQIASGNIYNHDLLEAGLFTPRHYGTGTLTTLIGSYNQPRNMSTGTVTDAVGVFAYGTNAAGGTITTYKAFRSLFANSGTLTTAYGLWLGALGATNSYGIWQDSSAELNVFKGPIWLDNKLYFDSAKEDYLHYTSDELNFYIANGLRAVIKAARFDLAVDMQQTGGSDPHKWGHGTTDLDIQFNSADTRTLDITNIGAGAAVLRVNGVEIADIPGAHAATHQDGGGDEIDLTGMSGDEIRLIPKASSTGAEGTLFYNSADDYVYVATE